MPPKARTDLARTGSSTTKPTTAATDATDATGTATKKRRSQLIGKWGQELIDAGYVVIPATILERQDALGLTAEELNVLLHILRRWWEPGDLPFPAKATIARAMGVHPRTVQRHITKLAAARYVERVERKSAAHGQMSNAYDLKGLIAAARPFAVEALAQRKRQAQERSARLRGKRAELDEAAVG